MRTKALQSFLGMLGVLISVAALIIMLSISQGMQQESLKSIQGLGLNTIHMKGELSNSDVERLKLITRGIISKTKSHPNALILHNNHEIEASIYRSDTHFLKVNMLRVLKGRAFFALDIERHGGVAIVNEAMNLDIGEEIIYQEEIFEVVAITNDNALLGNFVYLPLDYSEMITHDTRFDRVDIYIHDSARVMRELEKIKRHFYDGVEYSVAYEIFAQKSASLKRFNTIIVAIALLSMLSGGANIMNIMLSNIGEQTREIGLKMALGASKLDIKRYFILHTLLLTLTGYLLGVVVGYGIVALLMLVMPIAFCFKALFIAFMMSVIAGVVFGLYPALRASNITPYEALREY